MSVLVDILPALTHLGFVIYGSDTMGMWEPPEFDIDLLQECLRAALQYDKLVRIMLYVAGATVAEWDNIQRVIRTIGDARVYARLDKRQPQSEWEEFKELLAVDWVAGRSIWDTEDAVTCLNA